jgi:hypothetical protein
MASSVLGHPYADKPIDEIVPSFLQQPKLSAASLVQQRRWARYVPQGSSTLTQDGPNQINFIVSDSAGFLDPNSATLSGLFRSNESVANAGFLLNDGLWSLFLRLRVYVNGSLVEDINQMGIKENMEVYSSMGFDHYCSQAGALAMTHKYNNLLYTTSAGAITRKNDIAGKRVAALNAQKAGVNFSLPLSYISGFFRNEKAFPLLAAGQVQVTIDIQRPESAFIKVGVPTQYATPNWSINGLTLEAQVLTMHPLYSEAMVSLCRSPGLGYRLPITTHSVQQVSVPASAGTKTIAVPQAVSNLRQVSFIIQDTADLVDYTKDKTRFPIYSYADAFVQVGSVRLPENPAVGTARAYACTVDADNQLGSVVSNPVIDFENYCGATTSGSVARDIDADAFIWSVSCDKVKDTYLPVDGLSGSALGGQIVITINNTMTNPGTLTCVSECVRFLGLIEGRVEVV